ncbi:FAD-binding oxidoreductase [Bradyrhizobium sp. Arg62]|uniref:FAD-dependent oxidoreductase n=1 Tax=Bradyrhizobium brasilense TaxID=1419277 RepID=UPI001E3BA6F5|nr:FAD-dependent oxidoreductase [Bradyrhizobium brasilense]MCC8949391.1 FAD-binding oxidoreductase [Bradyrhizobium brasilense]
MTKPICVVGAGVIGLTTAIVLADRYDVGIIADKFGADTDSVKATAVWHVYLVPETAEVLEWSSITLQRLLDISRRYPESGIEIIRGVELFRTQPRHVPGWSHIPPEFAFLADDELRKFNERQDGLFASDSSLSNAPVKWGYRLKAPAAKMSSYLNWLVEQDRKRNVQFSRQHVERLADLSGQHDVVVNCTGLGAATLLNDEAFEPYKGQYFVVASSDGSPTEYIGDDDNPDGMAYVIPRAGEVMVGGSAEAGLNDLFETIKWSDVVARAGRYVPWIRNSAGERPPDSWSSGCGLCGRLASGLNERCQKQVRG